MSLNIKILFFLFFYGATTVLGQEKVESTEETFNDDPETVFFNLELFNSIGIGDHSLARDYNIGIGFGFDFNWFVLKEVTIGTHFSVFQNAVKNNANTGNIQNTTVYLFGLDVGYYYEIDQDWNLHATAGIGSIMNTHRAPEDKFAESGTSYWVQLQVAHRFNKTLAIYFKLQPRWDKHNIEVPEHLKNYFNNKIFLIPGVGIRINLQNPGG